MILKLTTSIPSSRYSLSKKFKNPINHIRGSSQTPTLRKKFSPLLNKSFNCYEEPYILPSYNRQSPLVQRESLPVRKTKNRLRIASRSSTTNLFSLAKSEMNGKNYARALELINKIASEDMNTDTFYLKAVCLMHLKQFTAALAVFMTVQESVPDYDAQLYIALYMCYLHLNDFSSALKTLNTGLKLFPKFSKGYMLRGQMMNKLKKYDKALNDFSRSEEREINLYIGESWKGKNQYDKALKYFELASKVPGVKVVALLEKAKIYYSLKKYKESNEALEILLEIEKNNLAALYYLAKIKVLENDLVQAALFLEQVIQNTQDSSLSCKALCKLALIRIREKDFYGALHTFHRTNGKLQSHQKLSLFRYTEGVISLMKRKFSEGISLLTVLINEGILKEYLNTCYLYRAYGHYAKGEYIESCKDYQTISKNILDKASEFNFLISQAIIKCDQKEYNQAWNIFKSLQGNFPKNPMPEICMVCILLTQSLVDPNILKKANKIIDKGMKRKLDSEILFIKSFLLYLQSDFDKSFSYIKEAIEKAEENIASHYIMRGFSNVGLKIYTEAISDFTIALQLNESLISLYPYRGVCAYLTEDYSQALEDFVGYSDESDSSSIILSAKLLMFASSYSEALQVLLKSPDTDEILALKAYCYMMINDYGTCIELLGTIKSIDVANDISIINSITIGIVPESPPGHLFNKKYTIWMTAVLYIYEKKFTAAIELFQDVLEIMHSSEGDLFSDNIIIEEENCEVLYNIALCNTLNLNKISREHALLILKELADVVNIEHRGQLYLISAIIELSFTNKEQAEVLLKESAECCPDACKEFVEGNKLSILPLHTGNEFSSAFPLIPIPEFPKVSLRPAITLPKFLPPLEMFNSYDIIKSFFNFNTINPRPEAPWLNRNKGSIQFTDSILDLEIEDSKKNSKCFNLPPKPSKSQEIRKKQSSFVKTKDYDSKVQINGLFDKIKEICS